jgi:hypothetical protein
MCGSADFTVVEMSEFTYCFSIMGVRGSICLPVGQERAEKGITSMVESDPVKIDTWSKAHRLPIDRRKADVENNVFGMPTLCIAGTSTVLISTAFLFLLTCETMR